MRGGEKEGEKFTTDVLINQSVRLLILKKLCFHGFVV